MDLEDNKISLTAEEASILMFLGVFYAQRIVDIILSALIFKKES